MFSANYVFGVCYFQVVCAYVRPSLNMFLKGHPLEANTAPKN